MNQEKSYKLFLLNYTFRDHQGKFEIQIFAKDTESSKPVKIIVDNFRPMFFVPRTLDADFTKLAIERKSLPLKSFDNVDVDCVYFPTYTSMQECARQIRSVGKIIYESDIHPVDRFLMERLVQGGFEAKGFLHESQTSSLGIMRNPHIRGADVNPKLDVLSFDIETNASTNALYSIASVGKTRKVYVIGNEPNDGETSYCKDEKELLSNFFNFVKNEDPDILIGWSVVDFDLRVLQERCQFLKIPFDIGREFGSRITKNQNNNQFTARIPGRVVLDTPLMLRSFYRTFEEYSLNFVASSLLGKTKTIELTSREKINEINRLFREDKKSLAEYNLQDAILTLEIFEIAEVLPNAVERSKRSGHLLDRTGGSVAAFDYLYLPRLHRSGFVAPDTQDIQQPRDPLPGGFVLEPKAGIYHNVLVFDFRSLYPSLIMTFHIDPLARIANSDDRVKGPVGPSFARDKSILPGIIAELLDARMRAKKEKNGSLSQAIKILMNSFYGVLGTPQCRFFSHELSTTITRTGQFILKLTIEHIERTYKYKVIYGDTDSIFVHLGQNVNESIEQIGERIASETTTWLHTYIEEKFSTTSHLLLQYENHFNHFFLPSLRGGGNQGSKKHYCGSKFSDGEMTLTFKGMESARSDWTDLAKEFQQELLLKVFQGEKCDEYIREIVSKVKRGELDEKLIYKKRLRKSINEYTTNVPPHAQAAKLLDRHVYLVKYYITTAGPQPLEKLSAPLDYDHYISAQLQPIADTILETMGTDFETILSGQMSLF